MAMDNFLMIAYMITSFLAWVLGIGGLFKVEPLLGVAAILYVASDWIKSIGKARLGEK